MAELTLREVVQRLRAENCRATLELREFQYALDDIVKNVERLAASSEEFHLALQDTATPLRERIHRLSTRATQIVLAFRAVRVAVLAWNVAGISKPTLHRTAVRSVVERLRAEGSQALIELLEFDHSLDQLLQGLGLLAVAAGELEVAVENIRTPHTVDGRRRLNAMRERAGQLPAQSTQVLLALRSLRADVARWDIMGASADTNCAVNNGSFLLK